MGLIRKSLALGTVGVVRPNSKKQRVAKKSLNELQAQTRIMQGYTGDKLSDLRLQNAEASVNLAQARVNWALKYKPADRAKYELVLAEKQSKLAELRMKFGV